MTEPVVSIDTIKRQAKDAAHKFANVNDACPYPFHTQAGQLFKATFLAARTAVLDKARPQLNLKVTA